MCLFTDNVRDIIDNEYQSIVSQFITLVDGKMHNLLQNVYCAKHNTNRITIYDECEQNKYLKQYVNQ